MGSGAGFSFFLALLVGIIAPEVELYKENDDLYCESWKYSLEVNDAGSMRTVPLLCVKFVETYLEGGRYNSDLAMVANASLTFGRTVEIRRDKPNAWIFDIDETLLSNLPYYRRHGYGSEPFDEKSFDMWVTSAAAPAIETSLWLYRRLKELGFRTILLTGRDEWQRNVTEKNLRSVGYSDWDMLLLRSAGEKGLPATVYKSIRRIAVQSAGYKIHGCSGDQWSDQLGYAVAQRSFKLPNPIYYIP